jgi:hypothetical protein
LLIHRIELKFPINGNRGKINNMANVQFGIELSGQCNAIGDGTIRKIGKVRGTKDIFHLYSHGHTSPLLRPRSKNQGLIMCKSVFLFLPAGFFQLLP